MCTLGEEKHDIDVIKGLLKKGMDVVRLNMNYFNFGDLSMIHEKVDEACRQTGLDCSVFVDLKGPVIRIGGFKGGFYKVDVRKG